MADMARAATRLLLVATGVSGVLSMTTVLPTKLVADLEEDPISLTSLELQVSVYNVTYCTDYGCQPLLDANGWGLNVVDGMMFGEGTMLISNGLGQVASVVCQLNEVEGHYISAHTYAALALFPDDYLLQGQDLEDALAHVPPGTPAVAFVPHYVSGVTGSDTSAACSKTVTVLYEQEDCTVYMRAYGLTQTEFFILNPQLAQYSVCSAYAELCIEVEGAAGYILEADGCEGAETSDNNGCNEHSGKDTVQDVPDAPQDDAVTTDSGGSSPSPIELPDKLLARAYGMVQTDAAKVAVLLTNVSSCFGGSCQALNLSAEPGTHEFVVVDFLRRGLLGAHVTFIAEALDEPDMVFSVAGHVYWTAVDYGYEWANPDIPAHGAFEGRYWLHVYIDVSPTFAEEHRAPTAYYLAGDLLDTAKLQLASKQDKGVAAIIPDWPAGAGRSEEDVECKKSTVADSYAVDISNCHDIAVKHDIALGQLWALNPWLYPACRIKPGDDICLDAELK